MNNTQLRLMGSLEMSLAVSTLANELLCSLRYTENTQLIALFDAHSGFHAYCIHAEATQFLHVSMYNAHTVVLPFASSGQYTHCKLVTPFMRVCVHLSILESTLKLIIMI